MNKLLVYMYKSGSNMVIGNCVCNFHCEPPTWENIEQARKEIGEKFGHKDPIILNWLPLAKEDTGHEVQRTIKPEEIPKHNFGVM